MNIGKCIYIYCKVPSCVKRILCESEIELLVKYIVSRVHFHEMG